MPQATNGHITVYDPAAHPECFNVRCDRQRPASRDEYFAVNIGPLNIFASEDQLRQILATIDKALLDAEMGKVMREACESCGNRISDIDLTAGAHVCAECTLLATTIPDNNGNRVAWNPQGMAGLGE